MPQLVVVWVLLFHSPVLMEAATPSVFRSEVECKAEARKRSVTLRGSTLYYECVRRET